MERLGSGGQGSCFKAKDVKTSLIMAVKCISAEEYSDDEKSVNALERREVIKEVKSLRRLQHSNIIHFYGHMIDPKGTIHMFLELMEESMADFIGTLGTLSCDEVRVYLHQILLGLDYIHANGIIHQDLKGKMLRDITIKSN